MEFEKSSLWREVQAVQAEAKPVHNYWTAEIHTPTETLLALKVLSVDIVENYLEDFSDMVVLRVTMSAGKFAKRVYPNKSQLEITLYKNPIGETSSGLDTNSGRESERYTATLFDRGSPVVEGNGQNMPSEDSLDLTSIETLDFQLVSKAVEQIRMRTVGGNFRRDTPENFLKAFILSETRKIQVDGAVMPNLVEMVPASNTAVREHFSIPDGTRLVDVPQYVQNNLGGIYSTGLGYYLKKDSWHFWPAFDVTRFDKAERTVTIINVPKNKMPGTERTYRQNGRNLVILATGEVKFNDDSEKLQLNEGNGVRAADATKFMDGWATTQGNKAVAARGANNNEFVGEQRPNGNNNMQMAGSGITANSYALSSVLARRQGSHMELVWENSDPKLLSPGIPARVLYLDGEEIKSLDGVFMLTASYVETVGPGLLSTRHRMNTRMTLFVKRKLN
jgi:hypothetical protein